MKHDMDYLTTGALPDAPLAMPKQVLERPRSLLSVMRQLLSSALVRS